MKYLRLFSIILVLFLCIGCTISNTEVTYMTISPREAKEIMDSRNDFVILDVRSLSEFSNGHIKDAIHITDSDIKSEAETTLLDKNQTILVYCRSGRRSAAAAKELVSLGYTDVRDFGGIQSWPYDIEY